MNRAILLDRDGTINVEINYLHEPEKFRFEEKVPESLQRLYKAGFKLLIITNQGAIGKGIYNLEDMNRTNNFMVNELSKMGIEIQKIYFCPHPKELKCQCRKPQPGMILQAISDFNLDQTKTWMIGDKLSDIEAGKRAGVKTILVMTGYGKEQREKINTFEKCVRSELEPTEYAENLWQATNYILEESL